MSNETSTRQPMKIQHFMALVVWSLATVPGARAATVWNGPTISFTKTNYANPLLAENQDRLTTNVWITRGSSRGLFNAKTESSFTHYLSPAGTEWANGSLENYATLSYTDWNHWAKGVNPNPYATVGVQAVLHLIPDDIYLSVQFTSWTGGAPGGGPSYGGGFSYLRSTPVPEPSSLLLFGILGLGAALAATLRSDHKRIFGTRRDCHH